jgi:ribosomal protein L37AE/L43A
MKDYCRNCGDKSPQDGDNGEYVIARNDVLDIEVDIWVCNNCKAALMGNSEYNE